MPGEPSEERGDGGLGGPYPKGDGRFIGSDTRNGRTGRDRLAACVYSADLPARFDNATWKEAIRNHDEPRLDCLLHRHGHRHHRLVR